MDVDAEWLLCYVYVLLWCSCGWEASKETLRLGDDGDDGLRPLQFAALCTSTTCTYTLSLYMAVRRAPLLVCMGWLLYFCIDNLPTPFGTHGSRRVPSLLLPTDPIPIGACAS